MTLYLIWQDTFISQLRHKVRLLYCRLRQQRKRSSNTYSTVHMRQLGFQSCARGYLCMDCRNHFLDSLSKNWKVSHASSSYLPLPLKCMFASIPISQMEIARNRFLQDELQNQIRYSYVSFSHDFRMNFAPLLRTVFYSLDCRTFYLVYR